jgi:hypothetical protein
MKELPQAEYSISIALIKRSLSDACILQPEFSWIAEKSEYCRTAKSGRPSWKAWNK